MIFIGLDFTEGADTLNETVTHIADTNYILLQNAIFEHFYITHKTDYEYSNDVERPWDFDTVLNAEFNGDLMAGNVNYAAEQVSEVRIKRRRKGTHPWTTLFAIPIETADSFHFERFDKYARSKTEYEYALVPVVNEVEGDYQNSFVYSEFEGIFLLERDAGYYSMLNVSSQFNKNHPTLVVTPVHRRYPYVFGNGNTNYYSGVMSAIFVQVDENCNFDWERSWQFRDGLMEFLCNGRAKLLKMGDGHMWMVSIVDSPSESVTVHELAPTTSFSWVEIDECESGHALYENDFIDANYDIEIVT